MKADISIRSVSNGWVVKQPSQDDPTHTIKTVYELESAIDILWDVAAILNLLGSRYDAKRLRFTWTPGDKHHDIHPTLCKDCACGCDPDQSTGPLDAVMADD